MTTNLKYSNRDPQQLLCQFFSRNIPIKSGHHLPKEFGDYLRIEVDKKNRREVNLLLIKASKIRRLNRANIPSKIRIDKRGFMELVFHFTEIGFGAVKPLDTFQFTFKLCLHLSIMGKSAGFLFLLEQDSDYLTDDIYLGRLFLLPNIVQLVPQNKKTSLVR